MPAHAIPRTFRETAFLTFVFAAYIFYSWDRQAIPVELPEIVRHYGLSGTAGSLLTSVYALGIASTVLLAGIAVEIMGVQAVMCFSVAVFSLCTGYTAFAYGMPDLIIARVGTGFGEGLFTVALITLLSRLSTRYRSTLVGLSTTITGLSGVLAAPVITTVMLQTHDWKIAFYLLGGLGVAFSALLLLLHDRATTPQGRIQQILASGRDLLMRDYLLILVIGVLCGTSIYGFSSMFTPYMRLRGTFSTYQVSLLFSAYGIGLCLGGAPFGVLADRVGRRRAFATMCALAALCALLIFGDRSLGAIPLGAACLLFGVGAGGIYVNILAIISFLVPQRCRPLAIGAFLTIYYFSAAWSGLLFQQAMSMLGPLCGSLVMFTLPLGLCALGITLIGTRTTQ